jgi:hypothetical protein
MGMICIAYLFIRLASSPVFSKLADPEVKKADLFIYSLVPLCFSFELSYHVEPLLQRAGLLLPVLGRQLGFNWSAFGAHAASSAVTVLQVVLLLVGLITAKVVLNKIRQRYEAQGTARMNLSRSWPLLFLATVYIYFFIAG